MSAHEYMNMARVRAEQMQRERDEARALVDRLYSSYVDAEEPESQVDADAREALTRWFGGAS